MQKEDNNKRKCSSKLVFTSDRFKMVNFLSKKNFFSFKGNFLKEKKFFTEKIFLTKKRSKILLDF